MKADACSSLFAATTPPDGKVPIDTLGAAQAVARNAAYRPERLFALLDALYPVPGGRTLRPTPFLAYLSSAPSAWVMPLKFTGGGLSGPGKIMFDSEGNEWSGANFIVGGQSRDALWDGNLVKFAPNGQPLSPSPTGFSGGGLEGPGFGTAIDANDNVWVTSTNGKTISLFDKNGKPLERRRCALKHARQRRQRANSVCLGLRISEGLALLWADVDWLGSRLSVRRGIVNQIVGDVKTQGSAKTFNLAGELLERLKSWKMRFPILGS